jgi:hypothetical protein
MGATELDRHWRWLDCTSVRIRALSPPPGPRPRRSDSWARASCCALKPPLRQTQASSVFSSALPRKGIPCRRPVKTFSGLMAVRLAPE